VDPYCLLGAEAAEAAEVIDLSDDSEPEEVRPSKLRTSALGHRFLPAALRVKWYQEFPDSPSPSSSSSAAPFLQFMAGNVVEYQRKDGKWVRAKVGEVVFDGSSSHYVLDIKPYALPHKVRALAQQPPAVCSSSSILQCVLRCSNKLLKFMHRCWRKLVQQQTEAEALPSPTFVKTLAKLLPSPEFEDAARMALSCLEEVARLTFGDKVRVRPFGSLVQGSHLEGSDLDVFVDCPGLLDGPVIDGKGQESKYPKAAEAEKQSKQVHALVRLLRHLKSSSFIVKERRLERHVRVPILILEFQGSIKVEADVSVGDDSAGVEKGYIDRLIQRAFVRAPVALPWVLLVKQWAKVEGLNKAYEGYLNSLGWTLLCFYFLMVRGKVPSDAFSQDLEDSLSSSLAPFQSSRSLHFDKLAPSTWELSEFFEEVAALKLGAGISLAPCEEVEGEGDEVFYIEDPASKRGGATRWSTNVAKSLRQQAWAVLQKRSRAASQALRAGNSEAAAAAWARRLAGQASAFATGPSSSVRGASPEASAFATGPAMVSSSVGGASPE
ncbi:unnamed protein product, partial [Polarella glacialis]